MPAFSGICLATTVLAQPMHFQYLRAGTETQCPGFVDKMLCNAVILELYCILAAVADQERHRMTDVRMMAGDIGID